MNLEQCLTKRENKMIQILKEDKKVLIKYGDYERVGKLDKIEKKIYKEAIIRISEEKEEKAKMVNFLENDIKEGKMAYESHIKKIEAREKKKDIEIANLKNMNEFIRNGKDKALTKGCIVDGIKKVFGNSYDLNKLNTTNFSEWLVLEGLSFSTII